jgi:hypothetical protein
LLLNQQNQQLDLVGGCNAINSRDLEIGGHVRSPPPLPNYFIQNSLPFGLTTISRLTTIALVCRESGDPISAILNGITLLIADYMRIESQNDSWVTMTQLLLYDGQSCTFRKQRTGSTVPQGMKSSTRHAQLIQKWMKLFFP